MMNILNNQYWFKKSDYQVETLSETIDKKELEDKKNRKLYCRQCKQHITDIDLTISINGAYTHTFMNPAGYVYTINCYQAATCCVIFGEPTDEHTWFPGYQWQIVLCQSCQIQLGWLFSNSEQFYALIEDRLTQII